MKAKPDTLTGARIFHCRIRLISWLVMGLGGVLTHQCLAYDVLARLDREGSPLGGPVDESCEFCENKSKSASVHYVSAYGPPPIPVAEPPNSQITGVASAHLPSGRMRGRVLASAFGHLEERRIGFATRIQETITVTFPAGLPEAERVVAVIGSAHGQAIASGPAVSSLSYSLDVNGKVASASQDSGDLWQVTGGEGTPGVVTDVNGDTCRFIMTVKPTRLGEVFITAGLGGTAHATGILGVGVGVAVVNALNTADLALDLPDGATFSSTSGVFLSEPPAPEISIEVEGGELVITFSGVLESSSGLAANGWTVVEGATSPLRIPLTQTGARFFRARTP